MVEVLRTQKLDDERESGHWVGSGWGGSCARDSGWMQFGRIGRCEAVTSHDSVRATSSCLQVIVAVASVRESSRYIRDGTRVARQKKHARSQPQRARDFQMAKVRVCMQRVFATRLGKA